MHALCLGIKYVKYSLSDCESYLEYFHSQLYEYYSDGQNILAAFIRVWSFWKDQSGGDQEKDLFYALDDHEIYKLKKKITLEGGKHSGGNQTRSKSDLRQEEGSKITELLSR